jgi:hypothetical protein
VGVGDPMSGGNAVSAYGSIGQYTLVSIMMSPHGDSGCKVGEQLQQTVVMAGGVSAYGSISSYTLVRSVNSIMILQGKQLIAAQGAWLQRTVVTDHTYERCSNT